MTTNVIIILHAGEKNSGGIITFAVAVKYGKHNSLTYALALSWQKIEFVEGNGQIFVVEIKIMNRQWMRRRRWRDRYGGKSIHFLFCFETFDVIFVWIKFKFYFVFNS